MNPRADTILGRKSYARLDGIPSNLQIDIVQVFRPSDQALDVVKEAVARQRQHGDIHVVWLQLDIRNKSAKQLAEDTGITFEKFKKLGERFLGKKIGEVNLIDISSY